MKRAPCAVAFVLLFLCSVSMPIQAFAPPILMSAELKERIPPGTIANEEAFAAAKKERDAFYRNEAPGMDYNVTSALLSLERNGKMEEVWFYSFRYSDLSWPCFEVIVSPTNQIIFADEYIWQEKQLEWEAEKGEEFNFWGLKDKELYYSLYFPNPIPDTNYMSMPGSDDLTTEQALQKARDALIGRGVSPGKIDSAKVSVNFWIETSAEEGYWILVYYEPDNLEGTSNVYQVNLKQDGTPFFVYDLYQDGTASG